MFINIEKIHTYITKNTVTFPKEFYNNNWHFHLFLDLETKIDENVKRLFLKSILYGVNRLIALKPSDSFCVGALFDPNDLFTSTIDVFTDKTVASEFFKRNDEFQKWIPLQNKRNISNELNLQTELFVCGFKTLELNDEDDSMSHYIEGELWYVGEVF